MFLWKNLGCPYKTLKYSNDFEDISHILKYKALDYTIPHIGSRIQKLSYQVLLQEYKDEKKSP